MKTVYIAHRLSAPTRKDIEANRARASRWVAWVVMTFRIAPIADWIIITGQLEETPENRALGLQIDRELVSRADEIWLVGGELSSGMREEAARAVAHGKPVRDLLWLGAEPPTKLDPQELGRLLECIGNPVRAVEVPNNNIGRDAEDDCG